MEDSDTRIELQAVVNIGEDDLDLDEGETACEKSDYRDPSPYAIAVELYNPDREEGKIVGHLGGFPDWLNTPPDLPHCPDCGRLMFYTGHVRADALRGDVYDDLLYGFQCETCGTAVTLQQGT